MLRTLEETTIEALTEAQRVQMAQYVMAGWQFRLVGWGAIRHWTARNDMIDVSQLAIGLSVLLMMIARYYTAVDKYNSNETIDADR